jgi:RNase P subunit RPR2
MTSSQHPSFERKSSVNSSTSTASTERKSSIGDISSLSELVKKKKKDARRSEIVAAVTKRLYSARKKVEMKPEPAEVVPEQGNNREEDDAEPDELKLCQRARARLQELSKKALHAQRGRMQRLRDVEAQTDFDAHVLRVKEVAVSTEEIHCGPHMFFTDNRRLLFTRYAYPSMRQGPAWSSLSIRNHDKLPNEDSFSDDSLDSTHEMDTTEEEKPSLWNVISISCGKQFKTNGVDTEHDQMFRNISTQTQTCSHKKDINFVQKNLDMEPDRFSIYSNDMVSTTQVDTCEHECTGQPTKVAKLNQLSSCLHKDTQQQADSDMCRCEPSDMDTGIIREDTSLQPSDHNLYTITENSEYSDSNDVTSGDYDSSYPASEPVAVTEKLENTPGVAISFPDTCLCRNVGSTCGAWQLPACESYKSFTSPDLMTYPHIPCCEASTAHTKHNHDWQQYKDKLLQTSPELRVHSAKESNCMLQKNSIQTTAETDSNTDIRKFSQNAAILYETKRRTCKQCNTPLTHSYNTDDCTKFQPAQSTKIEGTQYASTNMPVHTGTQTGITQLPSMTIWCSTLLGAYPQLLQLSNSSLHLEDYTAVLIPGHIPQPIIMKPVHWCSSKPSETVAVQTDENREQRSTDENVQCNMKSQLGDEMKGSGTQSDVPASQGREEVKFNPTSQSACGQSTSQQMTNRLITPEPCSEASHTGKADSSTSASALLDLDNFSDDEDAPCFPTSTVTPAQETEASGKQHWTDMKNLILGTGRDVFPYNITMEEENCSVQETKDTKKKCVSWSDLSGHGALHTEMVFASDHNLFDSSQVPLNKITKNSLFNVISTEPWRRTTER